MSRLLCGILLMGKPTRWQKVSRGTVMRVEEAGRARDRVGEGEALNIGGVWFAYQAFLEGRDPTIW